MNSSVLPSCLALLLTPVFLGSSSAHGGGGFFPVKAIVIGTSDLVNSKGVIATIRVEVPQKQRCSSRSWFDKGAMVDLEITARTKIEKLAGGKRTEATIDALVKGCKIEFRDYAQVLLSRPAIVSPGTVIIAEPDR